MIGVDRSRDDHVSSDGGDDGASTVHVLDAQRCIGWDRDSLQGCSQNLVEPHKVRRAVIQAKDQFNHFLVQRCRRRQCCCRNRRGQRYRRNRRRSDSSNCSLCNHRTRDEAFVGLDCSRDDHVSSDGGNDGASTVLDVQRCIGWDPGSLQGCSQNLVEPHKVRRAVIQVKDHFNHLLVQRRRGGQCCCRNQRRGG